MMDTQKALLPLAAVATTPTTNPVILTATMCLHRDAPLVIKLRTVPLEMATISRVTHVMAILATTAVITMAMAVTMAASVTIATVATMILGTTHHFIASKVIITEKSACFR